MKKITLFLVFIGMITLKSCTINEEADTIDNDTISQVYEYNRSFTPNNNFSSLLILPRPAFDSDMILVYRLVAIDNGADVWRLLPENHFFNDGTLDFKFDYDFTRFDVNVFMEGYLLNQLSPSITQNQILRVVVVPGFFAGRNAINFEDYEAVMKYLNTEEKDVIKVTN